jgi:hypothetical protein
VSKTFDKIRLLARQRKVHVSQHSMAQLARRGIAIADVAAGVVDGEAIEDYPDYHVGPAVLVLQKDASGHPLHVVWGTEKDTNGPAVVVTAYRPAPTEWSADFRSRKS